MFKGLFSFSILALAVMLGGCAHFVGGVTDARVSIQRENVAAAQAASSLRISELEASERLKSQIAHRTCVSESISEGRSAYQCDALLLGGGVLEVFDRALLDDVERDFFFEHVADQAHGLMGVRDAVHGQAVLLDEHGRRLDAGEAADVVQDSRLDAGEAADVVQDLEQARVLVRLATVVAEIDRLVDAGEASSETVRLLVEESVELRRLLEE